MSAQYKSISSENSCKIGALLRTSRLKRSLTLTAASGKVGVDAGQLSRFERGQFIRGSPNLQKYANYLQINLIDQEQNALAERVMIIASKSAKHREAVEEIVTALERIG
jgi:transcriptional regulator with XRE-family HTH domain